MRRFFSVILTVVLVFLFGGCGSDDLKPHIVSLNIVNANSQTNAIDVKVEYDNGDSKQENTQYAEKDRIIFEWFGDNSWEVSYDNIASTKLQQNGSGVFWYIAIDNDEALLLENDKDSANKDVYARVINAYNDGSSYEVRVDNDLIGNSISYKSYTATDTTDKGDNVNVDLCTGGNCTTVETDTFEDNEMYYLVIMDDGSGNATVGIYKE